MGTENSDPNLIVRDHPPAGWVLWVDDALLAINKPAGLRTLPDGYNPATPHLKSLLEPLYGRLWIVHRLDKETSGVIVLARTAQAHRALNTQFEQHGARKVYHALVAGVPEWNMKEIDLPLRPNGDRRHRTVVNLQEGRPAVTHLRVLERFAEYALIKALPATGRTHQIRAHLSAAGYPVAGDQLYGGGEPLPPLTGFGLHARLLSLQHPINHEPLLLEAAYPPDFQSVLSRLRFTTSPYALSPEL